MTQPEMVSETILQISRTFNAPRELVFQAWTQPESLSRWWAAGPGFTTPIAEVDLRVGGKYRLGMLAPDQDHPYVVGGVYKEVVHSEKLVYTWNWESHGQGDDSGSEPGPESAMGGRETLVTVLFRDAGDKTEVVLTHEFFSDANMRDEHNKGWNGCLENLAKLVE